jgi:hypothetical protein
MNVFWRDLGVHCLGTLRPPFSGAVGRESNGDLLALAEQEFDVFVTVDRKIAIEQDLTRFTLAVILLRAQTNRLEHIRPLAAALLEQLEHAPIGALTVIGS